MQSSIKLVATTSISPASFRAFSQGAAAAITTAGPGSNNSQKDILTMGYARKNVPKPNIHQADCIRFTRFMTGQIALPPTISHLISKEINRPPSLAPYIGNFS